MDKKPALTVVLPTYNESRNISSLIPKVEGAIGKKWQPFEILVVDDSSQDGTAEVARELGKKFGNIRVKVRPKKEGLGAALRSGYDNASGRVILSIDADMSVDPANINRLLSKIDGGYDLVVGSRHSKGSGYENRRMKTAVKKAISTLGNAFTNALLGLPVRDYSMNFRAIRKSQWMRIKTHEKKNAFLLEMIMETHLDGGRIAEMPFKFQERKFGKSKINLWTEVLPFLNKVLNYSARRLRKRRGK